MHGCCPYCGRDHYRDDTSSTLTGDPDYGYKEPDEDPWIEEERQELIELGRQEYKIKQQDKSKLFYNNVRNKSMNFRMMNGRH